MGMPMSSGGSYSAAVSQPLRVQTPAPAPTPAPSQAAANATAAATVDLLKTSGSVGTRLNTTA